MVTVLPSSGAMFGRAFAEIGQGLQQIINPNLQMQKLFDAYMLQNPEARNEFAYTLQQNPELAKSYEKLLGGGRVEGLVGLQLPQEFTLRKQLQRETSQRLVEALGPPAKAQPVSPVGVQPGVGGGVGQIAPPSVTATPFQTQEAVETETARREEAAEIENIRREAIRARITGEPTTAQIEAQQFQQDVMASQRRGLTALQDAATSEEGIASLADLSDQAKFDVFAYQPGAARFLWPEEKDLGSITSNSLINSIALGTQRDLAEAGLDTFGADQYVAWVLDKNKVPEITAAVAQANREKLAADEQATLLRLQATAGVATGRMRLIIDNERLTDEEKRAQLALLQNSFEPAIQRMANLFGIDDLVIVPIGKDVKGLPDYGIFGAIQAGYRMFSPSQDIEFDPDLAMAGVFKKIRDIEQEEFEELTGQVQVPEVAVGKAAEEQVEAVLDVGEPIAPPPEAPTPTSTLSAAAQTAVTRADTIRSVSPEKLAAYWARIKSQLPAVWEEVNEAGLINE